MWEWLKVHKEALDALQAVLTSAAILVGGAWALRRYWQRRDPHPKAKISHAIAHRRLNEDQVLLRVTLNVENCGETLLDLNAGLTRVSRVLPLAKDVLPERMKPPFSRERAWPALINDEKDFPNLVIEPKESDSISYDFILDGDLRTVLVYSHVENASQRTEKSFGWQTVTLYDVTADDPSRTERAGSSDGGGADATASRQAALTSSSAKGLGISFGGVKEDLVAQQVVKPTGDSESKDSKLY